MPNIQVVDKKVIIAQLKLLTKLLALHGQNPFRERAYARAADVLAKLPVAQFNTAVSRWPASVGLGERLKASLQQAETSGILPQLVVWEKKTPAGLLPLLRMRGLGATKLGVLWRELHITSSATLRTACEKGKVATLKGFGEKTQARICTLLDFYEAQQGQLRWDAALQLAEQVEKSLQTSVDGIRLLRTGYLSRTAEVLHFLEWVVVRTSATALIRAFAQIADCVYEQVYSSPWTLCARMCSSGVHLVFYLCADEKMMTRRHFLSSAASAHLAMTNAAGHTLYALAYAQESVDEAALYAACACPVPPYPMREAGWTKGTFSQATIEGLLQATDIKGVLHCHSHYSDGHDSLKAMALYAREQGYQYLGISDHSRSAFYANGMQIEDVRRQHEEIDVLNTQLAPFRLFKGIECDVLVDGALDYPDEVLATFDFVIISIHSQLQMDKEQATQRLLRAISHPCVQLLGHMSGRLLLERPPYPLDYAVVLAACVRHGVAIEFNANAYRLDLDWHWIATAQAAGIRLAINPDAHACAGMDDMLTALPIAQKGGLQREMTLNAYNTEELAAHFLGKPNRT